MSQNNCKNQDYSLLTASTSLTNINTANTSLTGNGATTIFTGAQNGSIIKSIIIKATGQVTKGMIRLFVKSNATGFISLYREVAIPTTPNLTSTATPPLVVPTYECRLDGGDLKLQTNDTLLATTQNQESYNIIVEGLNWQYPNLVQGTPPNLAVFCNWQQDYANNGINVISTGTSSMTGTGSSLIYSAGSGVGSPNGSFVKCITIKALQSTNLGMIRLFISNNGGSTWFLYREISVPETLQSGFDPSFKFRIEENLNLANGCSIWASTQLSQAFGLTAEGYDWVYPVTH